MVSFRFPNDKVPLANSILESCVIRHRSKPFKLRCQRCAFSPSSTSIHRWKSQTCLLRHILVSGAGFSSTVHRSSTTAQIQYDFNLFSRFFRMPQSLSRWRSDRTRLRVRFVDLRQHATIHPTTTDPSGCGHLLFRTRLETRVLFVADRQHLLSPDLPQQMPLY